MKFGWMEKTIGEVCDLTTGGTPSKSRSEYFEGGEIKWLVSGDVHQKEIWDCAGRITQIGYENSNARILPVNSVIIALNGQGKTRGTVAVLRTEATCNQSLVAITPRGHGSLMPEFLYLNLDGRYEEIRRITGDGGDERRGLNMPLLRSIKIPLPPLNEQKRIVTILDEAFEGLDRARANAEANFANARELFVVVLAEKMRSKDGGWRSRFVKETFFKIKIPAKIQRKYYREEGKFPIISQESGFINGYWNDETDVIRLSSPVILFGDHTRHLKYIDFDFVVGADGTQILHPISEIEPLFYYYALRNVRLEGKGYARHFSHLKKCSISYPDKMKEQKRIADELAEIENYSSSMAKQYITQLEAFTSLRQSLLQKAFSGELT